MQHLDAGHRHEQLTREMDRRAVAGGRKTDLAGIGLGVGDEFGDGLRRHRGMDLHHIWPVREARDRHDVFEKIVGKLAVERRVDGVRRRDKQQRVTVRRRRDDRLRRDIAPRPGSVLHDHLLTQPFRQRLRHDAGDDVGRPAGRKADDQAQGTRRIGLGCE